MEKDKRNCCSNCGQIIEDQYLTDRNYREEKYVKLKRKEFSDRIEERDHSLNTVIAMQDSLEDKLQLIRIGEHCPHCFSDLLNNKGILPALIEKWKYDKIKEIL